MTLHAFVALWTHRYHKYSHIAQAYFLAYRAWIHFKLFRIRTAKTLVAVVRTEHFGDIVAAEPLSRAIRQQHPEAHIVWFVKPVFEELIATNPNVDEPFFEFCVTQRRVLLETGVFDQVYDLQFRSDNNRCKICDVFIDNPSALAQGISVFNYFNHGSLLDVFSKLARLPVPADDQPRLYLQERHRQKANSLHLPDSFIVIHCQSNYAPKDWPADRWNALIEALLRKYDYAVVEVGLRSTLSVQHPSFRSLCGQLSILETAEVIGRARYFIGLDSGPSHLANATGVLGFVLMGSLGDFPAYNPYSGAYGRQENCVFIRKEGTPCAQLSLQDVQQVVEQKLPTTTTNIS